MEHNEFRQVLRQVMILPLAALLVLAAILVWQINGSNKTVVQIQGSDRRIALATRIEALGVDEETGLRGYQTTSDPRFLQPYRDAEAPMRQAIAELQFMTEPGREAHLKAFIVEHTIWHEAFADPLISTIAAGGQTNDVDLNLTGKASMDSMRAHLDAIELESEQRRTARIADWNAQTRTLLIVLIVLALGIGVLISWFTYTRLRQVSRAFRISLEDQHRRAEELFRSEQHLRTTLASIGDGVITCDADGKIQTMNPVAQDLTGWTEAAACDRQLDEVFKIVNENTHELVEDPVAKVKRLDRIVGLANHTLLIRRDGSELNIDDSGAPIRNAAGELTGIVLIFRDITLEHKTRAALLANEKLAVAGRLAATIAHEIHNPLDSVANLLYLLQHEPTPEETRQYLGLAQSELARVTQISRAMLSLYRESKAPVPVNLKDMLDDLLLLMEGRFHDMGVTVSRDIPQGISVDGFPAELRQVFTNLITNAAEAAGRGGTIAIRATPRPASIDASNAKTEAGAIVEIADSGPGIRPEVQERLFEPFFTTKGEQGTGLGLWVSQGIIRKHAGTIELSNSSATGGTTATVFLATRPLIAPGGD